MSGDCVLLLCGQPWRGAYKALLFDDEALAQSYWSLDSPRYFEGILLGCERCDCIIFVEEDASGNQGLYSSFGHANPTCKFGKCIDREAIFTDTLQRAFEAARQERFGTARSSGEQLTPNFMNIIDIVRDADKFDELLVVVPSKIQKIVMVRVALQGEANGQACVVGEVGDNRYILIEQGRLSFDGGTGGRHNLDDFRQWLDEHNLLDRVEKSLKHMRREDYVKMIENRHFDSSVFHNDIDKAVRKKEKVFQLWLAGDKGWYDLARKGD